MPEETHLVDATLALYTHTSLEIIGFIYNQEVLLCIATFF